MDLRIQKSKQAIVDAFLTLRARKPLEKITVRELCDKAMVNRSTFYAHYKDVYDLADRLEEQAVQEILAAIPHPEAALQDTARFTRELFTAFAPRSQRLNVLFSGSRSGLLITRIAAALKEMIFRQHPELEQDPVFQISLTFRIYGGYYTYLENRRYGEQLVVETISPLTAPDTIW